MHCGNQNKMEKPKTDDARKHIPWRYMYVYLLYFLCATHDLLFLFSCYFIRDACTAVWVAQRVCVYEWTIIYISGIVIANIYCKYIVILYGKVCMVKKVPGRFAPNPVRPLSCFAPIPVRPGLFRPYSRSPRVVSPSFINNALKNEMENTIANIRILDVVRLVHGYFIFVIINMLSWRVRCLILNIASLFVWHLIKFILF